MEAFRNLQHENLRYLNGEEDKSPSHYGPLNHETALISASLMRLCSMKEPMVVTTSSQPSKRSKKWCQRAYVIGFLCIPTSSNGDASRFMSVLADLLRDEGTVEFGLYRMSVSSPEWREHIKAQDPPIDVNHRPVPHYLQGVSFWLQNHEWTMYTNGNERRNPFNNWKEARWEVGLYDTADYAPSEDHSVVAFHLCDALFDFPEAERCVTVLEAALRRCNNSATWK